MSVFIHCDKVGSTPTVKTKKVDNNASWRRFIARAVAWRTGELSLMSSFICEFGLLGAALESIREDRFPKVAYEIHPKVQRDVRF